MFYRGYKKTKQDKFKRELKNITQNESIECYSEFEKFPKFLRDNHASFVSKRLRKPTMKRSELKLTYLKIQIQEQF